NERYLRRLATNEQRYRIVRVRGHNPDPSSRCIDQGQNALLPGWVGAAAQFALQYELCFSNPQSVRNNGKSRHKQTQAARGQAQSPDRALSLAGKVAL